MGAPCVSAEIPGRTHRTRAVAQGTAQILALNLTNTSKMDKQTPTPKKELTPREGADFMRHYVKVIYPDKRAEDLYDFRLDGVYFKKTGRKIGGFLGKLTQPEYFNARLIPVMERQIAEALWRLQEARRILGTLDPNAPEIPRPESLGTPIDREGFVRLWQKQKQDNKR